MAKKKLNTDVSIVDSLKSVGQDSSYDARKKLAQQLNKDLLFYDLSVESDLENIEGKTA